MLEQLLDALIDSLKLLPFLFLAYLLIEFVEHKASDRFAHALSKFGKFGGIAGAALGNVPQCGFSVAAANLYSGRLITFGTLIAVFIATSDEAVPVLVSSAETARYALWLVLIKFAVAAAAGLIIDFIFFKKPDAESSDEAHSEIHSHCHDCCEHGILLSALKHTAQIYLFLLLTLAAFNLLIYFVGLEALTAVIGTGRWYSPIICAIVGFIPNCASSVVLTELFCSKLISFGALVAGLTTNSGVALFVLFRVTQHKKEVFSAAAILLVVGVLTGLAVQLF